MRSELLEPTDMLIQQTTGKNIQNYALWAIPLIIVSKIVRWTIMRPQLVNMSIGWGYVPKIQSQPFLGFEAADFWGASNSATHVGVYFLPHVGSLFDYRI